MPRYRNTNCTTGCENVSLYYMQFNRGNISAAQIIGYPKYISRTQWLYGKAGNFSLYLSTAPQVFRQPFLLHFIISSKKCLQKSTEVQHHSVNLQNTCKRIIDSPIQKVWLFYIVLVATRCWGFLVLADSNLMQLNKCLVLDSLMQGHRGTGVSQSNKGH